jgi:hypothetical protein
VGSARAKLAADEKAVDLDLVDFIDMMLATGLRIGETAARRRSRPDNRWDVVFTPSAGLLRDPSNIRRTCGRSSLASATPASPRTRSARPSAH